MILSGLTKLWSLLTTIPRGWQIVFAVSLLVLAIMQLQRCAVKEAREEGASAQREANLTETVTRIQEAKNAEAKLDTDPDARRAGCMRHSRTPENC